MEKFNLACSSKTQEIKKLKSQENQNPKNGEMGDTEPPKNRLRKIKHTRSSILGYRVGLDTVATSYLVGWIESTRSIPGQIISNFITHHKKEPLMKLCLNSSDSTLDYKPHQRLIDPICPSLVITLVLCTFTDAKVIKLYLLLQLTVNSRTTPFIKKGKEKRLSYPLPPSVIEDTIRHNIVQITSTSKTYIP